MSHGIVRGVVLSAEGYEVPPHRLRVSVPHITGISGVWAMPCLADTTGLPPAPKEGDGVWVAFEDDNLNYPVWLGFFGSFEERPPAGGAAEDHDHPGSPAGGAAEDHDHPGYMPVSGGDFTGRVTVPGPVTDDLDVVNNAHLMDHVLQLMPKSGGTFTGPINVPNATGDQHPVTLSTYEAVAHAYWPWSAKVAAYSDHRGLVRVDIKSSATNPYYAARTLPPAWVQVTPITNADDAKNVFVYDGVVATLAGIPKPTKDAVYVGGFKTNSFVEFYITMGFRSAPLYAWDHTVAGGTDTPSTPPPAETARNFVASGAQSYRTYYGSGAIRTPTDQLYFGWYSSLNGNQSSANVFGTSDVNAMRAINSGKVTGCTLRFSWGHTYNNSGGAVRFRVIGDLPTSWYPGAIGNEYFDVPLGAKSGTTTVGVPVSVAKQFCSGGAAKGFAIEPAWAGQSGYGYLTPGSFSMTIHYLG